MSDDDWKTLRVPPGAYEEAKEQKEANGRTWGQQLVCNNDATTQSQDVVEMLRKLEGRIDDLESQLPAKVKEELQH